MGKTSVAVGMGLHAAVHEQTAVAVFSLEMSKEQLVMRMLCSEGRINSARMRTGFLTEEDWPKLARVAGTVLATVRRELLLGPAARARHRERLDLLGGPDDAALSTAITTGSLDERWDDVVATVREAVRDELLVANPRHLELPA